MANSNTFFKDPDSRLDFGVKWTDWLAGDAIASADWTVPAGLSIFNESYSSDTAFVWLEGGEPGSTYPVHCRITTVGGRIDDRTIYIVVKER